MVMGRIDRSKIKIVEKGFNFEPFRPTQENEVSLAAQNLKEGTELLVFERGGLRRAILVSQAIYHHLIQGELGGKPLVEESSGHTVLDRAAIKSVEDAAPFPPIPENTGLDNLILNLTIHFQLKE